MKLLTLILSLALLTPSLSVTCFHLLSYVLHLSPDNKCYVRNTEYQSMGYKPIGMGQFSVVWLFKQVRTHHLVAIRVIRFDKSSAHRTLFRQSVSKVPGSLQAREPLRSSTPARCRLPMRCLARQTLHLVEGTAGKFL